MKMKHHMTVLITPELLQPDAKGARHGADASVAYGSYRRGWVW